MNSTLFNINQYLNNPAFQYLDRKSFWDNVSTEAVEEFLQGFTIAERYKMPASGEYTPEMIEALEAYVIAEDDNPATPALLDGTDVKIATAILLFKIYTDSLDISQQ